MSRIDRLAEGIRRSNAAGNLDDVRTLGAEYRRLQGAGASAGQINLNIEGKRVQVDQGFSALSPEDQNRTVDEIAGQIGVKPSADLARIKSNVAKMAAQNAPEADIDGYIASEGVSIEDVRNFNAPENKTFQIKTPDGRTFKVMAPDQETAASAFRRWYNQNGGGNPQLNQFRQQYPEFNDMGDQQVADEVHKRFYSTMPRADFDRRIGLQSSVGGIDGGGAAFDPKRQGMMANIAAAPNDVIASTLGAPVDAARGFINTATQPNMMARNLPLVGSIFTGTQNLAQMMGGVPEIPDTAFGGRRSIIDGMSKAGVTDPDTVQANTADEKIMRAIASGTAAAIAPEALLATLGRAGIVGGKAEAILQQIFGRAQNVRESVGNAVAGGLAGGGAEMAAEAAPDNLKPLMATLGGFAGAGLGTGLSALPRMASAGGKLASDFLAPISQGGRDRLVGQQLNEGATSSGGVLNAINNSPPVLVPGSKPTTGQLTGDMGILSMERGAATKDPGAFQQRRADQNAARISTMEGMQPSGAPEHVVTAVRSYLSDIDNQLTQSLDTASSHARGQTAALGPGRSPEIAGADVRGSIETARASAKAQERALWQAVDPDGTLALPANATRSGASKIAAAIPTTAKPAAPEEAAIFKAASNLGQTARFSDITALQSRIKAEMRAEKFANGESPAYRRLVQLNEAVQRDLEGAIVQKVAQEQKAVAAGQMSFEQTIEANIQKWQSDWRARNSQAAVGFDNSSVSGRGPGSGAAGPSGVSGTTSETGLGLRGPSGNSRLPSNAGGTADTNFDAAALGRLNAARTATRERAETFDNTTLAPLRQRPSSTAPYQVPDAGVAQRLFYPQPKSFDAIQSYRRAVGDQRAIPLLTDYAVDRLRRSALGDDGLLNPAKLASWRRSHSDAIRAIPGLDGRLANVENATLAMGEAAATRRDVLDTAEAGAIGKVLRTNDPQEVTRAIGSIFGRSDSAAQMFRLNMALGSNKEARQGLRKAVVDHIMARYIGNTEAATSGLGTIKADQLQTFISQNQGALRAAGFTDAEIKSWEAIALDLQRSNRSLSAVRIPGQSNTAQDALASRAGDTATTSVMKVLLTAASSGGGWLAAGGVGAIAAPIITGTVSILRQNGIRKMDELLRQALLDPEIARPLMMKASKGNAQITQMMLAARFRRSLISAAAAEATTERKQPPLPRPVPIAPPIPSPFGAAQ
ncbi:MAG: hypothetical protein ABIQ30_10140 [Devosia sp.]